MKNILSTVLALALCSTLAHAQQLKSPRPDSLTLTTPRGIQPEVINPDDMRPLQGHELAQMPTVDFPLDAKMLTWWPDDGVHYFMPNMLSPRQRSSVVDGEKLKGKKLNSGDESR